MSKVTFDIGSEERAKLVILAEKQGLSLDAFLQEVSKRLIAQEEVERRFHERAARGDVEEARRILRQLDEQN